MGLISVAIQSPSPVKTLFQLLMAYWKVILETLRLIADEKKLY